LSPKSAAARPAQVTPIARSDRFPFGIARQSNTGSLGAAAASGLTGGAAPRTIDPRMPRKPSATRAPAVGPAAGLPDLTRPLRLPGLEGRAEVWRDPEGVPHVQASSTHDAFFAQGLVHAQDRLWQMEHDRRRAGGRLAECVGPSVLPQDVHARRLRLAVSARADYAAVNRETRAMPQAYAAGLNAVPAT